VTDWSSLYRAELVAIILAVLTVPQESKVEIVTDSAMCISTYNRISKPDPKRTTRRWIKEKNWSLWMRLIEIVRRKRIWISFKKVKAHSGNTDNDRVDRLAKEGRNASEVIWKDPRCPIWSALPIWNNQVIDISVREFVKEVHRKETVVEWSEQNRIQKRWAKEIREQDKYSWKMFWEQCRQGSSLQTSLKQAKERNFRIKLMNDELPTMERLTTRRPDLYKSPTCILCEREEENTEHLFDCPALIRERSQMWKEAKEKVASRIATKGPFGLNRIGLTGLKHI
jgi:ribonuclease HI